MKAGEAAVRCAVRFRKGNFPMTDCASESGKHSENRRDFLYLTAGLFTGLGTALALWPFMHSLNPTGDVLALETVDVDIAPIETGQSVTVVWQGKPVFDSETLKFKGLVARGDGPLKLWFKPGLDNSAPLGPFTFGCDIAMGSDGDYSSNSVACALDDRTGEQVLEYQRQYLPDLQRDPAAVLRAEGAVLEVLADVVEPLRLVAGHKRHYTNAGGQNQ